MEELLSFLDQIATAEGWPLSAACLAHLRMIIKYRSIKTEEYLLKEGEICANLYFIQKGLLKCFYILHDDDVSDWFFGELEVVVSIDSFYDQTQSKDYIQALEDTELFYITYEDLKYLYKTFVEFNVVGRVLTNKYLRIWHRQARNLRMLTKEERYALLLENQPELVRRVPVQDLASYLDMRRETLSRMRGRLR
ncbi:Crp/Fnr family transcriptional regulator [Flavitalea sp. BT771]|uniref:Crp/Fnr family transcriptional regulator n=1 Tax=Flavitalea sp. BT771 TaxID=3063329 RepID=UPI0026E3BCD9|nr:Crp/Fnr family transcriptional regulator [Flavitalea sp. BT771]MDO6431540.1 Crp/Fnr family transcriptional regulator [Flavitalea sp. BT771]MDV6220448.1 Crp/Fnr family transcriptional regulator [Flavitalea sp. BT771]